MLDLVQFFSRVRRLSALTRLPREQTLALQQRRWRQLLRHAHDRTPFYRRRLAGLDLARCRPADVPPLTKAEMMDHFDELVTDRQVRLDDVVRFMDDPAHLGKPYRGRYAVCHTSGSQGRPAVVVQERPDVYLGFVAQTARGQALDGAAVPPGLVQSARMLAHRLRKPGRLAVVTQKPGFYPSGAVFAYLAAARLPVLDLLRLSVFTPTAETVARLNAFQPEFITGYTSSLEILAREQRAGRLRLRPGVLQGVTNTSEPLPAPSREFIEAALGAHVSDHYAMAECMALTSGCTTGRGSHVNADLALLEVVDDEHRPVPDGTPGTRVLVTSLTNRVQPLIRYEVGDVVTLNPAPCPCGSPMPRVEAVAGRTKDRLWVETAGRCRELPYYLFLAGLHHCTDLAEHQVVQTGANRFLVRAAPQPGKHVEAGRVLRLVRRSLAAEGLADALHVEVEVVGEILPDPGSGKMKRVQNLAGPPPRALEPVGGSGCAASPG